MEKADLLSRFESKLELLEKYQTFIDKAQGYAERFNPAVVQKVIEDNTAKVQEVTAEIEPLVQQVHGEIADIEVERGNIQGGVEDARMRMEEYELRMAIGELDDDTFASETAADRGIIDGADAKVAKLDEELASLMGILERWNTLAPAEQMDLPAAGVADDDLDVADDPSEDFGILDDGEESGDSLFSADDLDDLGDDSLEASASAARVAKAPEMPVLVRDEDTEAEITYTFENEVMSIGRGRENTIQVTGDSKVSRYHCKLYSRDGNFFIEDNQSANGTLVDGEMVKERRLFGGEEITIGETAFRFRIPA